MAQTVQLQILIRWDDLPVRVQITDGTLDKHFPSKDELFGYFEGTASQLIWNIATKSQTSNRLLRAYFDTSYTHNGDAATETKLRGVGFRIKTPDDRLYPEKDYIVMTDGGLATIERHHFGIKGVSVDEFSAALEKFYSDGESDTEARGGSALEYVNNKARRL